MQHCRQEKRACIAITIGAQSSKNPRLPGKVGRKEDLWKRGSSVGFRFSRPWSHVRGRGRGRARVVCVSQLASLSLLSPSSDCLHFHHHHHSPPPSPPLRAASPLINLHLSPLSTVLCSPTFGSIAAADCIPRFPSSRLVRDYFISLQRFSLRLYQRPATHLHLFPIRKRICIAFRHLSRLL